MPGGDHRQSGTDGNNRQVSEFSCSQASYAYPFEAQDNEAGVRTRVNEEEHHVLRHG